MYDRKTAARPFDTIHDILRSLSLVQSIGFDSLMISYKLHKLFLMTGLPVARSSLKYAGRFGDPCDEVLEFGFGGEVEALLFRHHFRPHRHHSRRLPHNITLTQFNHHLKRLNALLHILDSGAYNFNRYKV